MKRKIIIGVLILIVVAAIIGYRMYSKQTPDIVQDDADVTVTAKELIAAFEKDTAAASKIYLDKIVEVTGTVKSVDTSGGVVIGEEGTASSVACGIDRRHKESIYSLKVGVTTTIQGKCSGYEGEDIPGLGTTVHLAFAGIKNKK